MAGPDPSARIHELRRDELFEAQCLSLDASGEVPRLAPVLRAIQWAVTHAPHAFPDVGDDVRVVITDSFPGAPAMRAYFTIDPDDAVTLRWIELQLPPDEAEDESG